VKVTDFGLALLDGGGTRGVTTHSGSEARPVRWLAPEALQTRRYSLYSDVCPPPPQPPLPPVLTGHVSSLSQY